MRKAKEEVDSAVQQYVSKKLKLDYPGTGLHKKAAVVKSALSQYNIPDLDPQMSESKGEGPFDDTDSEVEEPKVSKGRAKNPPMSPSPGSIKQPMTPILESLSLKQTRTRGRSPPFLPILKKRTQLHGSTRG